MIWTDETRTTERMRFSYPRQSVEPWLCIADFFRPIDSGELDYAAFHIVTMGAAVSERAAELFAADKYQDYLLLHGIGVEMAEALAELWHYRIREEWGFVDEDGPNLAGLFRQQVSGRALQLGLPRVSRPRGQHQGRSNCSTGAASGSSATRKQVSSTSPNKPPAR